ncbi:MULTISPECIES: hypothetical protein [unclassified Rhodococcus (in: high G+C Gram-positive bacteria)]|uniref:hypothetical protein n=1 Tax=unclassified Rhodococcus (in: high G+C Gram-positive bacteria) TaxID=192944 RepID=UPI00339A3BF3
MPDGFVRRLLRVHGTQSMHRFTDPTPVESVVDVLTVDIDNLDIEDGATPPPVVGLKAALKLSFRTADEPYARPFPRNPTWAPDRRTLESGGTVVYWINAPQDPEVLLTGDIRGVLSGTLLGGSTPNEIPLTIGLVIGIKIRSQTYQEVEGQGWEPIEGSDILRAVTRSPRWFYRGEMRSGYTHRMDVGLVLDIAVDRQ